MRQEVESLIRSHDDAGEFIEVPAAAVITQPYADKDDTASAVGQRIGVAGDGKHNHIAGVLVDVLVELGARFTANPIADLRKREQIAFVGAVGENLCGNAHGLRAVELAKRDALDQHAVPLHLGGVVAGKHRDVLLPRHQIGENVF